MIGDITKNILVTGARGQLGTDVMSELLSKGYMAIGPSSDVLDITNADKVSKFFCDNKISMVIHCAAYTKVDMAEDEKEKNYAVNVDGTNNLVKECGRYNIPMIFFSTDYVFGGDGDMPYREDDTKNPLGEYAKAKYEAEKLVETLDRFYILRISWVFGKAGNNFVKTMLKLAMTNRVLNVVSDQIGSPTYTVDVSKEIIEIMNSDKYGVYHLTNEGFVSWADFAREIFKIKNLDVKVNDITTEMYKAKAKRPKNSRLDKSKLYSAGFSKMPTWQDALKRYLETEDIV